MLICTLIFSLSDITMTSMCLNNLLENSNFPKRDIYHQFSLNALNKICFVHIAPKKQNNGKKWVISCLVDTNKPAQ